MKILCGTTEIRSRCLLLHEVPRFWQDAPGVQQGTLAPALNVKGLERQRLALEGLLPRCAGGRVAVPAGFIELG